MSSGARRPRGKREKIIREGAPPLRPPVDLVDSSLRAEVSLATASAMRAKALLEYREARCRGAAWLWRMWRAGDAWRTWVGLLKQGYKAI